MKTRVSKLAYPWNKVLVRYLNPSVFIKNLEFRIRKIHDKLVVSEIEILSV